MRFSQEVAEDYQLIFAERGAHTFVATHDGHPYVAPFSGNIIELCPVGALTSKPYRFRARPWDIEGAGGICTLCPSQCNVEFTVRDEKVMRVLARDPGNEGVDDGWLCDKGRFAYQAIHVDERITAPLVRDGGELREVSWERALEAAGRARPPPRARRRAGRRPGDQRGGLPAPAADARGARVARTSTAGSTGPSELSSTRALAAPALQATVPDLEFAHTVLVLGCEPLDDAPILDLRIRKGVRRHGVKLAVATARPSALDPNATRWSGTRPGEEAAFWPRSAAELRRRARVALASCCARRRGRRDRLGRAARARTRSRRCSRSRGRLGLAGRDGAGLLEIPSGVERPRAARGGRAAVRRPRLLAPSGAGRVAARSPQRPRRRA